RAHAAARSGRARRRSTRASGLWCPASSSSRADAVLERSTAPLAHQRGARAHGEDDEVCPPGGGQCDTGHMESSARDAFRFDATRLPVLVVEVLRGHSDDEHRAYLETLERYYRENDLLVVVFDIRTTALPSASQRRAQSEWNKRTRSLLHRRGATIFV